MNTYQRQERARIRRKKQVAKQKCILGMMTLLIIVIGSIIFGSMFSSAKEQTDDTIQYKYYKSIVIESGESLWSIAQEYRTDAYEDTQDYIDELKELNGLTSERIHEGQHLVVAYYDTEIR